MDILALTIIDTEPSMYAGQHTVARQSNILGKTVEK
jgi:hypothetical protein